MADTTNVVLSGDARIDALLGDTRWDEDTLTYAFPQSGDEYGSDFTAELRAATSPANTGQRRTFFNLLDADSQGNASLDGFSVEGLTRLNFDFAGNGGGGDLRIAANSRYTTAYAYLPSENPVGGDIWLGTSTTAPLVGNNARHTLMHELGHALGLKHPHEGGIVLASAWDSPEYTVMSYRPYAGSSEFGYGYDAFGAPQALMMLDIAALQQMYGADYSTNSGNTVYGWNPASGTMTIDGAPSLAPGENRIFATIWDGGGSDLYDLSAYETDLRINLAPGGASIFSDAQLASLGDGIDASGNIYNALTFQGNAASLIEGATGGTGNDAISGNAAANLLRGGEGGDRLIGGSGNDRIYGDVGADRITGGPDNDSLYGGEGTDRLSSGTGNDRLYGGDGSDMLTSDAGNDRHFGGTGNDTLDGGSGSDDLSGEDGNDVLLGGDGNDTLRGGDGFDVLFGNLGDDAIYGGATADYLSGRAGSDTLFGGEGADRFVFSSTAETQPHAGDWLVSDGTGPAFQGPGAAPGDLIDLSAIDANSEIGGNQAFLFGTSQAIGHLWLDQRDGDTRVLANSDADPAVDLVIFIADGSVRPQDYNANDFLL